MIPDNLKASDARVQSFELRFIFTTQKDKLIIEASSSKDSSSYIGEIVTNPYVDFQDIKQSLLQGQFKTLIKNEDMLKIKIGPATLQMTSKSKSQIKELKQQIQKCLDRQQSLEAIINCQSNQIVEIRQQNTQLKSIVNELKDKFESVINLVEGLRTSEQKKVSKQRQKQDGENIYLKRFEELSQKQYSLCQAIRQQQEKLQTLRVNIQQKKNQWIEQRTKIGNEKAQQNQQMIRQVKMSATELRDLKGIVQHIEDITNVHRSSIQETATKLQDFEIRIQQLEHDSRQHITQLSEHSLLHKQHSQTINQTQTQLQQTLNQLNQQQQTITINSQQIQIHSAAINKINPTLIQLANNLQTITQKTKSLSKSITQHKIEKIPLLQNKFNLLQQKSTIKQLKWSQLLKSNCLQITGNVLKRTQQGYYQFGLLELNLSSAGNIFTWAIKINKNLGDIQMGICLKNVSQKRSFNGRNISFSNVGHGCYFINAAGSCYSHSQKQFNDVKKSFPINLNEVINCEYNRTKKTIKWSKSNENKTFQMPVQSPPIDDSYYPCVIFCGKGAQVQLIL